MSTFAPPDFLQPQIAARGERIVTLPGRQGGRRTQIVGVVRREGQGALNGFHCRERLVARGIGLRQPAIDGRIGRQRLRGSVERGDRCRKISPARFDVGDPDPQITPRRLPVQDLAIQPNRFVPLTRRFGSDTGFRDRLGHAGARHRQRQHERDQERCVSHLRHFRLLVSHRSVLNRANVTSSDVNSA